MRPSASYTTAFFEAKILELCAQSGINEGGRCRLSLDRISGGAYLPDANEATYYIEVSPYEVNHFELNARGLELDIYQEMKLQKNLLSNFKTKMGLPYVMAALYAKSKGLDDVFLTDYRGQILESSSCNFFIISNGVLYTPSLEEGCLAGTMRMQVINLALANGIKVYESSILPQHLLAADEIFLTNAIRGINWVGGYRTKRYQNNISRKLVVLLNAHWEKATQ
jgi:branched-chain amino acid aminotransferase